MTGCPLGVHCAEQQARRARPIEDLEPTFFLDGQSYVYTDDVCKGGPELAALAMRHTLGYMYLILGEMSAGRLCPAVRLRQQSELIAGMWKLEELIPGDSRLVPNASLVILH